MLRKSFVILFSFALLLISLSCSQPSGYDGNSSETVQASFKVADKKFSTLQQAADYVVSNYSSLSANGDNVITLLENTTSSGMDLTNVSSAFLVKLDLGDKILTLESGSKIAIGSNSIDLLAITGSGGKIVSSDNAFVCGSGKSGTYSLLTYGNDVSFENITFKDFYIILENKNYTGSFSGSLDLTKGSMEIESTQGTYDIKEISISHENNAEPTGLILKAVKEKNDSIILRSVNAPTESDYTYLLQVNDEETNAAYKLASNDATGILNLKNCSKDNLASLTPHLHSFVSTTYPAEDCQEMEYVYKICDCGYADYVLSDKRGPHKQVGAINAVAPTALSAGTKAHYACADCGDYFLTLEDAKNDKVLDQGEIYEFPPELSNVGEISRNCQDTLKNVVEKYKKSLAGVQIGTEETRFFFTAVLALTFALDVATMIVDKTGEKMQEISKLTNEALQKLSVTQQTLNDVNTALVDVATKTQELNNKIDEIYKNSVIDTYLEIARDRQQKLEEVFTVTTNSYAEIIPLIEKHQGTTSDEVIDKLNEWGQVMMGKGLTPEYFLRSFYEKSHVTFDGAYVSYMDAVKYRAMILFPIECESYINYMACIKVHEEPVAEIATLAHLYYLYSTDVADGARETALLNLRELFQNYKKEYDSAFKYYNERYKLVEGQDKIELPDVQCFIPGIEGFFYEEMPKMGRMKTLLSTYDNGLCDAYNEYRVESAKKQVKSSLWYTVTCSRNGKEYRMTTNEVSKYLVQYLYAGKFIETDNYVEALKYMGFDLSNCKTIIEGGINCYDQGKKYIVDCGSYWDVATSKKGDVCHLLYMEPHKEIYSNPDDYLDNGREYEGRITRLYKNINYDASYLLYRPLSGW